MNTCTTVYLAIIFSILSLSACGSSGDGTDNYIDGIREQASRYNSARDVVDQTIRRVDSAPTLREGTEAARRGVSDLESAINQMNEAYKELGSRVAARKYNEHQRITLSAWRAGIEATISIKLYLEKFLATGQIDDSLVLAANRPFGDEDARQLEARRALQEVG